MLLAIYTRITEVWKLVRALTVQLELQATQTRMDQKLDLILVELTPGKAEMLTLEAGPVEEQP
jgi:hypothetical protein